MKKVIIVGLIALLVGCGIPQPKKPGGLRRIPINQTFPVEIMGGSHETLQDQ